MELLNTLAKLMERLKEISEDSGVCCDFCSLTLQSGLSVGVFLSMSMPLRKTRNYHFEGSSGLVCERQSNHLDLRVTKT